MSVNRPLNRGLSYLIDDYIYTNSKCTLYSYITRYIDLLEARPEQIKLRQEYFEISERISNRLKNGYCMVILNIEIDLLFYTYNLEENMISINKDLKDYCNKWDLFFNRHKERKLLKVIIPAQKRFLERLFNPHTPLGYKYGIKKRDELPWNESI
jgi:hypothetical protein